MGHWSPGLQVSMEGWRQIHSCSTFQMTTQVVCSHLERRQRGPSAPPAGEERCSDEWMNGRTHGTLMLVDVGKDHQEVGPVGPAGDQLITRLVAAE